MGKKSPSTRGWLRQRREKTWDLARHEGLRSFIAYLRRNTEGHFYKP